MWCNVFLPRQAGKGSAPDLYRGEAGTERCVSLIKCYSHVLSHHQEAGRGGRGRGGIGRQRCCFYYVKTY